MEGCLFDCEADPGVVWVLLLSMCVRMSFVYLSLFVISALFDSRAWFKGKVDLSPFLFT
jgi:hypothetical protein